MNIKTGCYYVFIEVILDIPIVPHNVAIIYIQKKLKSLPTIIARWWVGDTGDIKSQDMYNHSFKLVLCVWHAFHAKLKIIHKFIDKKIA